MKTDAMRSNEVEFFAEVRQRGLCIDARDDAANAKQLGRAAEERFVIGIQSETFVAEKSAEVEKITGSAAKIQDVERRRAVKPEVLRTLYIDANPVVGVLVRIDLSRVRPIGIKLAQSYQFRSINRGEDASRTYGMRPTTNMLPQALCRVAGKELLEFLRKSHDKMMQRSARYSRNHHHVGCHSLMPTRISPVEPWRVMNPLAQPLWG